MEGMLSLDNAVVLAVTVKHLPPAQQQKALTYGIWGAFAFRFIALLFISTLIKMVWLKVAAACYLIWIGGSHFLIPSSTDAKKKVSATSFWSTILVVEMLDMVFSLDSIFAAVGTSSSFTVIFIGGILGIIMMRFAAKYFIILVDKFKKLESVAYILVLAIGVKLGFQAVIGML